MEPSKNEIVKNGILPQRPQQRPDMRAEPQREAAREEPRKKRRIKQSANPLEIPKDLVPDGFEIEWKRRETAGKEDGYYQADLRQNHWVPVMAEDAPELAPYGQTQGPIVRADLILMKRESYLCDEARQEVAELTDRRLRAHRRNLADAPDGTFTRQHSNLPNFIRKSSEVDEFIGSDGKPVML